MDPLRDGVFHLIMAGGSGTRFWPLSRSSRPKQFLALAGEVPLLRQAYDRAASMSGESQVYVAAGRQQREAVLEALPGLDRGRLIEEPCGRNTAPCVGLASLKLRRINPDSVMVATPADHIYTKPEALRQALAAAVTAARAGDTLVTLGIRPSRPETGYGYIELESAAPRAAEEAPRRVARFIEKPDLTTARKFLASGRHLWNSGLFVWRTRSILREIQEHAPDIWRELERADAAIGTPQEEKTVGEAFERLAPISIDYAVLEKARDVMVVPTDPGWSDVGSWDAVTDLYPQDAAGNAAAGDAGDVLWLGSRGCFARTTSGRLVAVIGAQDLVIVDTQDALLVCRKGETQSVRSVVEALKARGRGDLV